MDGEAGGGNRSLARLPAIMGAFAARHGVAMRGQIILSHGSDSSPDATKVSALAVQAEALGWRTQRPDYGSDDARGHAGSVAPRVARLRATIEALDAPPVLVGSSMGAF